MLSLDVNVALFAMHFSRHFPISGHLALILQLHDGMVLMKLALFLSMVLLYFEIRFAILGIQL